MLPSPWYGLVLGLCWGTFGLVWIGGALYNAARSPEAQQRSENYLSWLVGIILVLAVERLVPASFWRPVTSTTLWLGITGAVCLIVSTAFTLWARGILGTMWSSAPLARVGHRLRTTGPYSVTRHPIYTGILGMLLGTALLSGLGPWIAYWLIGVAVLATKIVAEERLMLATFGEEYHAYQRRVPQLVPGAHVLRVPAQRRRNAA
jgi:protein-S-isoprenylcysteine O-methyltransferase Ste14